MSVSSIQAERYFFAEGVELEARDDTRPPPKPPRQRRRAAQTGARRRGNGLAERGWGIAYYPAPGPVDSVLVRCA